MANQEQLELLKRNIEDWNKWREDHPNTNIDLSGADLRQTNLTKANLRKVNLTHADLRGANLRKADLNRADLKGADVMDAILIATDLTKANLITASFSRSDLRVAILTGANLTEAILRGTDLTRANLASADLTGSEIGNTTFGDNDLGSSVGLERTWHVEPSIIGIDTIRRSKGKIPVKFLRGCGLSEWEIEAAKLYDPDLSNEEINNIQYRVYDLRATRALQISPVFISYSHADGPFVDKLEKLLNEKGIRFWRDIHDMKAGRVEKQIDRAIRQNPTVLLILSENSIRSDWVQHEVHTARELEKEMERDVLCPVALDDSWQHSPWPKRLMEQVLEYNILDCSCWQDDHEFKRVFVKLVDGLNLYYKKV